MKYNEQVLRLPIMRPLRRFCFRLVPRWVNILYMAILKPRVLSGGVKTMLVTVTIKRYVRYLLIAMAAIVAAPIATPALLERYSRSESEVLFTLGAQCVALFPGFLGDFVRTAYYLLTLESFHSTAVVSFGSYFSRRDARVAQLAWIGAYCIVGLADLGEGVQIASRVSIVSGLRQHGTSSGLDPMSSRTVTFSRVRLGENTWVGEGAIIGCDIGSNSIIGVGAVVTNPVPDFSMAMGNPARLLPRTSPPNRTAA